MSREIKFRAWDKDNEIMIYSDNCDFDNTAFIVTKTGLQFYYIDTDRYLQEANTVNMQYTGLKDKNGKEIYKGDILKVKTGWYMSDKENSKHKFNNSIKGTTYWSVEHKVFSHQVGFRVYGIDRRFNKLLTPNTIINNDVEVVGNIYENSELLE